MRYLFSLTLLLLALCACGSDGPAADRAGRLWPADFFGSEFFDRRSDEVCKATPTTAGWRCVGKFYYVGEVLYPRPTCDFAGLVLLPHLDGPLGEVMVRDGAVYRLTERAWGTPAPKGPLYARQGTQCVLTDRTSPWPLRELDPTTLPALRCNERGERCEVLP